jgi:hypothetical protein
MGGSRPELEVPAVAPWPNMAGARGLRDLGHERLNRKHQNAEELGVNSPGAKIGTDRVRLGLTTARGGRWLCKEFGKG